MRFSVLVLVVWLWPLFVVAQQVRFEASADARQVTAADYVTVTFTLENARGGDFQPPDFMNDFIVRSGPNRSVRSTALNNVTSFEMSWSYALLPKRKGKLTIPPAAIVVDGRRLTTDPLTIEVVEGFENTAAPEVMLEAVPSSTSLWVGEQMGLDYRLFFRQQVESYNLIAQPGYQGFFAERVERFNKEAVREVRNGLTYYGQTLERWALFPQQAGLLRIDTLYLQVGISREGRDGGLSPFFRRAPDKYVAVRSDMVEVEVKPLPAGAPPSFTGAVGQYVVATSVNRRALSTDDVLELTLTASGNGDIKRMGTPGLELPEGLEAYEPKVTDHTYELNGQLMGKKSFTWFIVAERAGTYTLQPKFSYFDPESSAYVTYDVDSYRVQFSAGKGKAATDLAGTEAVEGLRPLLTDIDLDVSTTPFVGGSLFGLLMSLPFFGLAGLWMYVRRHRLRDAEDPMLRRSKLASRMARERLQQAKGHMESGRIVEFYRELTRAVLRFSGERLRMQPGAETRATILKALGEKAAIAPTLTARLESFLQRMEGAVYGGVARPDAMSEDFEEASVLLAELEELL